MLVAQGALPSALVRNKVTAVLQFDLTARDITQMLVDRKVESALDFSWSTQLKAYYAPDSKAVSVSVADFSTAYSFEYAGAAARLVVTPLTERCFVTLTTALRLYLGGCPVGPTATGKTETVRELSRALGLACYVFNCSEQMSHLSALGAVAGLVQTGAMGCFDDLDRVPANVLSVFSSQLKLVFDAIARFAVAANRDDQYASLPEGMPPARIGDFDIGLPDPVGLVGSVGFFATLNPAYAGRSALPESLRVYFRPCAMATADIKLVSEISLLARGYLKARLLASKLVALFSHAADALPAMPHLSWGARSIMPILNGAGELRFNNPEVGSHGQRKELAKKKSHAFADFPPGRLTRSHS